MSLKDPMTTTLDRLVAHQNAQNELTAKLIQEETLSLRMQIRELTLELSAKDALLEQLMPKTEEA